MADVEKLVGSESPLEVGQKINEIIEKGVGGTGYVMFDTILKDHILTYKESKGLALQGTYVYKEAVAGSRYGYPDFYNKVIEEFNEATLTETVNNVTVKVHSNGHKFYEIADKEGIDSFFNTMGTAWFYGIDFENKRIFLPRNNYFEQVTGDFSEVGQSVEAGLPNITGTFNRTALAYSADGCFTATSAGAQGFGSSKYDTATIDMDASRSNQIYGKSDTVQPNAVKKLLYICVGNTVVESSVTDVVEITTTENDTLPLLHHIPADELLEHPSWLRSAGQWNDGTIYKSVYGYLVKEYTYGTEHTDTLKASDGTEYTVTYKTIKGKKVVDVANVSQVDAVYNAIGSAWYYVIDQNNITFRLPMSHNSECYTSDPTRLGLDVSAGLPNITGKAGYYTSLAGQNYDGALYLAETKTSNYSNNGSTASWTVGLDASLSSPVYGNSDTVTPPHTEFYLYFKVANAVQNLELLDAGKVMEKAVLRSSLVEAQIVIETYQNGSSGYRIWSDGYCEQWGITGNGANQVITLLKPYISNDYVILVGQYYSAGTDMLGTVKPDSKTQTGFTITGHANVSFNWQTSGYIK